MLFKVKNQGQKVSNRTFPVRLARVLNCGISGIEKEEISRDFADILGRVRHSQKSKVAKNWITGSAIYRPFKITDKTRQENVTLGFQNAEINITIL